MAADGKPKVIVTVTNKGKPKVEILVPVSPEESLKKVAGRSYVRKLHKARANAKKASVAEKPKKYKTKA